MSQARLYRIRPPSSACTWWNRMSFSSVAAYTLTGTFTSPNATEPFQMARTDLTPLPTCRTAARPPGRGSGARAMALARPE